MALQPSERRRGRWRWQLFWKPWLGRCARRRGGMSDLCGNECMCYAMMRLKRRRAGSSVQFTRKRARGRAVRRGGAAAAALEFRRRSRMEGRTGGKRDGDDATCTVAQHEQVERPSHKSPSQLAPRRYRYLLIQAGQRTKSRKTFMRTPDGRTEAGGGCSWQRGWKGGSSAGGGGTYGGSLVGKWNGNGGQ